ncbi:MAG TPA: AbiA family abortive infection protein, partial [Desulfitobacterium dehalogenans]|nr:AbiA family abortive infection protein [Desulfitobacterium dehalogenans]
MFSIEYEDWKRVCAQIFIQKRGRKKMYLQWYPFTRLSNNDKETLMSEDFFCNFIQNGVFLYYSENWLVANNYIMKGDGNFRNASLISPIMYLLALTIGKTISKKYVSLRPSNVTAFYAGNFDEDRFYYRKDYDVFFKTLNNYSQSYQYFIKTDIKDFFPNINVNRLFEMIDHRLEETGKPISQKDLLLYKELLLCMGQGEFPLVENSAVSSYLATIIYLEQADTKLHDYIQNKENEIIGFSMVRYVDDLYILFNSQTPENILMPVVSRILNSYSSELKAINLSLNRGKTSWKRISELNDELEKSLYDEQINGKEFRITDLVDNNILMNFLEQLENESVRYRLDTSRYMELIKMHFSLSGVEYTPQEVYNSLVYEKHDLFLNEKVIEKLRSLISFDYSFLKLDAKRLTIMVLKTKNGPLVKCLLSKLFDSNRKGTWNIFDTSLAINYLLQRNFEHCDLLKILKQEEKYVYSYYDLFCRRSFLKSLNESKQDYICIFGKKGFSGNDDK